MIVSLKNCHLYINENSNNNDNNNNTGAIFKLFLKYTGSSSPQDLIRKLKLLFRSFI